MNFSPLKKILLILVPALFLLIIFTGCGSEAAAPDTGTFPDAEKTPTSTGLKPLTQEYLDDLVAKRLDNPKDFISAIITTQGNDEFINIKVNRPETCHDGAVIGIGALMAQKTMALLFKYPEVARVELTVFGTSALEKNEEVAIWIAVDRAAAQKMDWFQFNDRTMPQMATEYFVDSRIQENYNLEGGDPSGPRSQQTSAPNTSST